jgi:HAD superfamily hydrolase (TIGR01509 family)
MSKKIPLIALIGLPNAGKSTMLNRISGSRAAIVAKEAHTTRDLNYGEDYWEGMYMRFVDTGGLVPDPSDKIQKAVQIRSWSGIAEADLLVWVIDRKQDPETIPENIIQKIWKTGKPVLVCINKVEDPNLDKSVADYARLGGFDFVNVSSTSGYGLNTMMDILVEKLLEMGFEKTENKVLVSDQKKREKRNVPREVRRHKDGGYYIVRNEDDGLFESVDAGEMEDNQYEPTEIVEVKKLKNIVFDLWGVVFNEDTDQLTIKLSKQFDGGEDKLDELKILLDEMLVLARKKELGKEWVKKYESLTGLEAFKGDIWGDNFYLNDAVVDIIKYLATEYNLYYLTNIDEYNFLRCSESEVFSYFKGGIPSYKTEFKKPDPEIYKLLLEKYKLKAEETVFIDDSAVNVQAATDLGIHGIVYDKDTDIESEIQEIENSIEPELSELEKNKPLPKILLLGKPNVGKSTLFNAMVGKEIQIVTDIAGTTLSVNDMLLERTNSEGAKKQYILLDSTGIRRPGQRTFGAETFATFRTVEAAHQADVICLILDGSQSLSHQDQVVAGIVKEAHKGLVVVANKDDLVDPDQRQKFVRDFYNKFAFLKVEKFIWVTAKESNNGELQEIWDSIDESLASREMVIEKSELRRLFNYLMKQKPPKKLRIKKRPVVYDLLYTKTSPPTFELLVKDRHTIHWSYLRFLENIIRKNFGFVGTEIVVKTTEVDRKKVMSD